MTRRILSWLPVVFTGLFSIHSLVAADNPRKPATSPNTVLGVPNRAHFNINRISTGIFDDGRMDVDLINQINPGLYYPKGSGKSCVYCTGLFWGAHFGVGGPIQVGGTTYYTGLQTGKILPGLVADDPSLPKNRIYRVRADIPPGVRTASVNSEIKDFEGSAAAVYDQYEKDWQEWPWQDGAPFDDRNHDGVYDATVDIPGVKGADQTLWFVANDLDAVQMQKGMMGCHPMGIEVQYTVWGYSSQGALDNIEFRRYLLINKGSTVLDSMYVSLFVDPDVGDPGDDLVGCDTSRSLGFAYNSREQDLVYQPLPPPAVGFDFFQGPLVQGSPTDSAIFMGKRVYGKRNLPLTAFYVFSYPSVPGVDEPDWGSSLGALPSYNYLRGLRGITGQPYQDPDGNITKFPFAGDPVKGTGWLDGVWIPPGDRRLGISSGPFTMAPGDTQEIVLAVICAGAVPGISRLAALTLLKSYDDEAQKAYDNFFEQPVAPPVPPVGATELDREILLAWDGDPSAVDSTENFDSQSYAFQGYNIYQLPSASASLTEAQRLATYDIVDGVTQIGDQIVDPTSGSRITKVVQFGTDSGIKRRFQLTRDIFNNSNPLINGTKYYLAVTAYSYNPAVGKIPSNLETPLRIYTVVPHSINPGVRFSAPIGQTSMVTHASGIADTMPTVNVAVTDPTKLLGANYTLGFSPQPHIFSPTSASGPVRVSGKFSLNEAATVVRYLITLTAVDSLSGPITNANLRNAASGSTGPVIKDVSFTIKDLGDRRDAVAEGEWSASSSPQPLTPALVSELIAGRIYLNVETAAHPTGEVRAQFKSTVYPWYLDRGSTRLLSLQDNYSMDSAYFALDGVQVKIGNILWHVTTFDGAEQTVKANPQTDSIALWGDATVLGSPTGTGTDQFGGGQAVGDTDLMQDLEFRFTGVPAPGANSPNDTLIISGGSIATIVNPRASTTVARVRVPFEVWEVERNRQINVAIRSMNNDGKAPWGVFGKAKWYRMSGKDLIRPISTPYNENATVQEVSFGSPNATWTLFFHTGIESPSHWETGDRYVVKYRNPVIPGVDTYAFTTPGAPSYSADVAKQDITQINVFPNPYYGANPQELDKYVRFVTFSHLPPRAIIRIFNLAGVMVRRIDKDTPSQFERWDLKNDSGLPVGSGLYIAYIEMPDLGSTKILKIAVVQEQQILDRY
jgi:hypothetical protein